MNQEVVIKGTVGTERTLAYMLPFQVPAHTDRTDVTYSYGAAISSNPELIGGKVVDIGIFDLHSADFMSKGFRGWSGSERLEFLSPQMQ